MTTGCTPVTTSNPHLQTLRRLARQLETNHTIDPALRHDNQSFALALIDAFSFAAKEAKNPRRKDELYGYKKEAVEVALALGCSAGLGKDDFGSDLLFLHAPDIGVVTVHTEHLGTFQVTAQWPHAWCAIPRQNWAFAALEHLAIRKLLAQYTAPGAAFSDYEFYNAAAKAAPHYTLVNHLR